MTEEEVRAADLSIAKSLEGQLCSYCPPVGYPNSKTRCGDCPRRSAHSVMTQEEMMVVYGLRSDADRVQQVAR
jgi:hypothetical protein